MTFLPLFVRTSITRRECSRHALVYYNYGTQASTEAEEEDRPKVLSAFDYVHIVSLLFPQVKKRRAAATPPLPPPSGCDLVGPPDKVTNLRPVRFHVPHDETDLQRRLRHLRHDTHQWSDRFWRAHNTEFAAEKESFAQAALKRRHRAADAEAGDTGDKEAAGGNTVSSEEMSRFYRDFLNRKWPDHLAYNVEWQKRNLKIVLLTLAVSLQSLLRERKS